MATYGALERMMVYMITKSENRKCLGPATRPHSKGVSDVWKSQRKETCFDRDGTLFPDFGKEAPSEKNFRLNVERLVENAMILLDVPVPVDEEKEGLEHYAYLLYIFETLRSNPTEKVEPGKIAGVGLTKTALSDAARLLKKQPGFESMNNFELDRTLRLRFIENMVLVAETLRRVDTRPENRTWQQEQELENQAKAVALKQESEALADSAAGRGKKRPMVTGSETEGEQEDDELDADALQDRKRTKYQTAKAILAAKKAAAATAAATAPRADPISLATEQVSGFLVAQQRKQQQEALQATAAVVEKTIKDPTSYHNEATAQKWVSLVTSWGLSVDSMDMLNEEDMAVHLQELRCALKKGPARVLQKYMESLTDEGTTKEAKASKCFSIISKYFSIISKCFSRISKCMSFFTYSVFSSMLSLMFQFCK